ncbi:MAG TPA: ABC transporter ATP-binding protein [Galbitalea sp.]|nr:ABC transporter ATP-binding protein [Galbitalea sp.]
MSEIRIERAVKRFDAATVLDGVNLTVPQGSITAVLGRSGSGKTTLLRVIAGFERLDAGTLSLGGRVMDDSAHSVPAQHRGIGYVPQDGALFPNLTALGNIAFGLPRSERARADELLELVGLSGMGGRRPHELSGGQQQRVALARALAIRPAVLLLDEPFSSLDASMRVSVRRDVMRILAELGTTTILVTHDQDEALSMAHQVALLSDGRVIAAETPRELYLAPRTAAVASSLGEVNILRASLSGMIAQCVLGRVQLLQGGESTQGFVLIRAENIEVHERETANAAPGQVEHFDFFGHDALVRVSLQDSAEVLARVAGDRQLAVGQRVWVSARGPASSLPRSR